MSSQGIVAIDGKYGTLSEIALAMKAGMPIVGVRTYSLAINENTGSLSFKLLRQLKPLKYSLAEFLADSPISFRVVILA